LGSNGKIVLQDSAGRGACVFFRWLGSLRIDNFFLFFGGLRTGCAGKAGDRAWRRGGGLYIQLSNIDPENAFNRRRRKLQHLREERFFETKIRFRHQYALRKWGGGRWLGVSVLVSADNIFDCARTLKNACASPSLDRAPRQIRRA
jgi:hypothetical protein